MRSAAGRDFAEPADVARVWGARSVTWRSRPGMAAAAAFAMQLTPALAQDKPYDGMTLNLASQNDQFAAIIADLTPQFAEETGITVKVDILSYPELLTKITSDFIGDT